MSSRSIVLKIVLAAFLLAVSAQAQEVKLTSSDYPHQYPEWSPDGNWVVYQVEVNLQPGVAHIYKVPAAGGAEVALTTDTCLPGYLAGNRYPRWSPDGGSVGYRKVTVDGRQIFKVPSAGGTEVCLTGAGTAEYEGDSPEWSPDGNWLAYSKYEGGYWRIFRVPAAGGTEEVLTSECFPYGSQFPQWSPDGSKIAFVRGDASGHHQLWTVTVTGDAETQLTSDAYEHWGPQWSPDGNSLVYYKLDSTGLYQLYRIPSAGGAETALTFDHLSKVLPQWSPDGNWIAYQKQDTVYPYYPKIYKIPATGGTETRLTNNGYENGRPQWSPDGSWIAYQRVDESGWQIYKVPSVIGIEEESGSCVAQPVPSPTVVSRARLLAMMTEPGSALFEASGRRVADPSRAAPGVYIRMFRSQAGAGATRLVLAD